MNGLWIAHQGSRLALTVLGQMLREAPALVGDNPSTRMMAWVMPVVSRLLGMEGGMKVTLEDRVKLLEKDVHDIEIKMKTTITS